VAGSLQHQNTFSKSVLTACSSRFLRPTDGGYGSVKNGSWSGTIGLLVRKEAEVAVGAYVMTELLLKYVDFASPMGATK
jgi:hypothetical protein